MGKNRSCHDARAISCKPQAATAIRNLILSLSKDDPAKLRNHRPRPFDKLKVRTIEAAMPALFSLAEAAATLSPRARLLALDLGTKTIGLAVATWPDGVPTALGTIRRTRFQQDAAELMDVVRREQATLLVLGLPSNMDGTAGPRVQATKAFARSLQAFTPPPILLHDERLTTVEAEDRMRAAGIKANRRAEVIDAAAAVVILESALAALSRSLVHREDS
jgi:putative holliday junction resolvase